MYVLVGFLQITEDTREEWEDDAEKFVLDDDDETLQYSVRISAKVSQCRVQFTLFAAFTENTPLVHYRK